MSSNLPTGSKPFSLDRVDKRKIRNSALLSLGSLALVVIPMLMAGFDSSSTVGGVAVALSGFAMNALRKWVADNSQASF